MTPFNKLVFRMVWKRRTNDRQAVSWPGAIRIDRLAWPGLLLSVLTGCAIAVPDGTSECATQGSGVECAELDHGLRLTRCSGLTVETSADLAASRHCREIDGDLVFDPSEPMRVTAQDLPFLERVRGSLHVRVPTRLIEVTLPALREVGTQGADSLVQFGFDQPSLQRISLPALSVVHGSLGIGPLAGLTELQLSSLERVDNVFGLMNLPRLTTLDVPANVSVGTRVAFELLCQFPHDALPNVEVTSAEPTRVRMVGCCTQSRFDCEFAVCECE